MRLRTLMLSAMVLACACHGLRAQTGPGDGDDGRREERPRPGWSLERTWRAFLRGVGADEPNFFPRRGDWEYRLSLRDSTGRRHPGIRRFAGADADSAIYSSHGPLCSEFENGAVMGVGSLAWFSMEGRRAWRRSGTRYTARDPELDTHVWVRWRREDRRWVVDAIGRVSDYIPPPRSAQAQRDTLVGRPLRLPLPADARLAPATTWYAAKGPVSVNGRHLLRFGEPRRMRQRELAYYTSYDGVAVYARREDLAELWEPYLVYVPVDASGLFQEYWGEGSTCRS